MTEAARTQDALEAALRPGARIANARGVPGTLGCFALTLDGRRLVFLTSHHVLFGAGASEQQPVWIAVKQDSRQSFQRIGLSRHGRLGAVDQAGMIVHLDCATGEFERQPQGWRVSEASASEDPTLAPGDRVSKIGAATGTTYGVVVDTKYSESAWVNGRKYKTAAQILVRPVAPGDSFTGDGDSGAVLRNADGAVVGLLWGADARGYGLACPIAPVLSVLHVCLARVEPTGA